MVSAKSDKDALTADVIRDWLKSVGFSEECLNLHLGNYQAADLGENKLEFQSLWVETKDCLEEEVC